MWLSFIYRAILFFDLYEEGRTLLPSHSPALTMGSIQGLIIYKKFQGSVEALLLYLSLQIYRDKD